MDSLISFFLAIPIWVYLWTGSVVAVIVLFLTADYDARRQIEHEDGYDGYCDPAHRVTQSRAACPRVVRGPFKRVGSDANAATVPGPMDGGAAA